MRLLLILSIVALIGCSDLPQTAPYQGGEENSSYRLTYTVSSIQVLKCAFIGDLLNVSTET